MAKAKSESIERRKKIKELEARGKESNDKYADVLEALGFDAEEGDIDLSTLTKKAKGKADETDALTIKLRKLEREKGELTSKFTDLETKVLLADKKSLLNDAIGKHDFISPTLIQSHFLGQVELVDGEALIGDKSVSDALAEFAKENTTQINAKNANGGGFGGGDTTQKTANPFAIKTLNLTEQARLTKENPKLAEQLKNQI